MDIQHRMDFGDGRVWVISSCKLPETHYPIRLRTPLYLYNGIFPIAGPQFDAAERVDQLYVRMIELHERLMLTAAVVLAVRNFARGVWGAA